MSQIAKNIRDFVHALSYYVNLFRASDILIEDYIERHLRGASRHREPGRLGSHEFQMFSQSGADGIIAEIFRRIGRANSVFVEFGAGDGLENNTAALLLQGWSGLWLDASPRNVARIRANLRPLLDQRKLTVLERTVTPANIADHFAEHGVPHDLDLVSVDIDGNDYWVWEALLARYAPRAVVIEYNALLGPSLSWTIAYNPRPAKRPTIVSSHFGASLKALEMLGRRSGYSLVGCDFLGVNAFFVRDDLLADRFCAPFTAENHFEPDRLFLYRRNGPRRKIGRFENPG